MRARRAARWSFISRRRLRSTAICAIRWLSAASVLFVEASDAARERFLFFRSLDPAASVDLVVPEGSRWW